MSKKFETPELKLATTAQPATTRAPLSQTPKIAGDLRAMDYEQGQQYLSAKGSLDSPALSWGQTMLENAIESGKTALLEWQEKSENGGYLKGTKGALRFKLAQVITGNEEPSEEDVNKIATKTLESIPTREELAVMVCRAVGAEPVGPLPYKAHAEKEGGLNMPLDIAASSGWSKDYIRAAWLNGLLSGYGRGQFGASDSFDPNHTDPLIEKVLARKDHLRPASHFEELYRQGDKYTRAYLEANPEIMGNLESEIFLHEMIAHNLAYKDATALSPNEEYFLHSWGYQPEGKPVIGVDGFYAVVFMPLEGEDLPTIVAFRGTEPTYEDILTDTNTGGVGYDQYHEERNQDFLGDVLSQAPGPYVAVGHSLGGAQAQRFAINNPDVVAVSTFQSPGLSGEEAEKARNYQGKSFHYVNGEDVVHTAGEQNTLGAHVIVVENYSPEAATRTAEISSTLNEMAARLESVNSVEGLLIYAVELKLKGRLDSLEALLMMDMSVGELAGDVSDAHGGHLVADKSLLSVGSQKDPTLSSTVEISQEQLNATRSDSENVRQSIGEFVESPLFQIAKPHLIAWFEVQSERYKSRDTAQMKELIENLLAAWVDFEDIENALAEVLTYLAERNPEEFVDIIGHFGEEKLLLSVNWREDTILRALLFLHYDRETKIDDNAARKIVREGWLDHISDADSLIKLQNELRYGVVSSADIDAFITILEYAEQIGQLQPVVNSLGDNFNNSAIIMNSSHEQFDQINSLIQ